MPDNTETAVIKAVTTITPDQILKVHGPYEDAIIALCELFKAIVDGQPPEVKRELWTRWLEITKPLHEAAVESSKQILKLIGG